MIALGIDCLYEVGFVRLFAREYLAILFVVLLLTFSRFRPRTSTIPRAAP